MRATKLQHGMDSACQPLSRPRSAPHAITFSKDGSEGARDDHSDRAP